MWLVALALGAYGRGAREAGVVSSTERTFAADVLGHPGPVAVLFYSPWCPSCRAFEPMWLAGARAVRGRMRLVAVDATKEVNVTRRYGVKGYPELRFFARDKTKPPTSWPGKKINQESLIATLRRMAGGGGAETATLPVEDARCTWATGCCVKHPDNPECESAARQGRARAPRRRHMPWERPGYHPRAPSHELEFLQALIDAATSNKTSEHR